MQYEVLITVILTIGRSGRFAVVLWQVLPSVRKPVFSFGPMSLDISFESEEQKFLKHFYLKMPG
jgi:hypothetical protein